MREGPVRKTGGNSSGSKVYFETFLNLVEYRFE
jgi:hypothetical protein